MTCEDGRYFIHEGFDVLDADTGVVVLHALHDVLHLSMGRKGNCRKKSWKGKNKTKKETPPKKCREITKFLPFVLRIKRIRLSRL